MAYADRKAKFSKLEFAKLNSKWANRPRTFEELGHDPTPVTLM
jgi:hypothetical protein